MKIDYEILRERLGRLMIAVAKEIDALPDRWYQERPVRFEEVEYAHTRVDEAYRRVEAEWSRLSTRQLEDQGGTT